MEDMEMQLVYATGRSRRDFQIAARREEVPSDARVYATCTQGETVESIGETTFQNMSDAEYSSLKAMVREARERASKEKPADASKEMLAEQSSASTLRNILGKLFSR